MNVLASLALALPMLLASDCPLTTELAENMELLQSVSAKLETSGESWPKKRLQKDEKELAHAEHLAQKAASMLASAKRTFAKIKSRHAKVQRKGRISAKAKVPAVPVGALSQFGGRTIMQPRKGRRATDHRARRKGRTPAKEALSVPWRPGSDNVHPRKGRRAAEDRRHEVKGRFPAEEQVGAFSQLGRNFEDMPVQFRAQAQTPQERNGRHFEERRAEAMGPSPAQQQVGALSQLQGEIVQRSGSRVEDRGRSMEEQHGEVVKHGDTIVYKQGRNQMSDKVEGYFGDGRTLLNERKRTKRRANFVQGKSIEETDAGEDDDANQDATDNVVPTTTEAANVHHPVSGNTNNIHDVSSDNSTDVYIKVGSVQNLTYICNNCGGKHFSSHQMHLGRGNLKNDREGSVQTDHPADWNRSNLEAHVYTPAPAPSLFEESDKSGSHIGSGSAASDPEEAEEEEDDGSLIQG